MRMRFLAQVVVVSLVAAIGSTGCGFTKKKSGAGQAGGESGVPPLGTGGENGIGTRPMDMGGAGSIHGQFAPVLFDYDSARIRPSEVSKLEAVAAYLKSNPGKLVVEGYCDERGTAEFNRALGERRALAARDELVKLGIDASRITTISYGKERPVDPGHDEAAWAKNRRCEFVSVNQ